MNENEIMKALECCIKAETWCDCESLGCPASTEQGCLFSLRTENDGENTIYIEIIKDALDLINRKNSEIEKVRTELDRLTIYFDEAVEAKLKTARAEAIKEFAERVKENEHAVYPGAFFVYVDAIDQIAKEMGVEL